MHVGHKGRLTLALCFAIFFTLINKGSQILYVCQMILMNEILYGQQIMNPVAHRPYLMKKFFSGEVCKSLEKWIFLARCFIRLAISIRHYKQILKTYNALYETLIELINNTIGTRQNLTQSGEGAGTSHTFSSIKSEWCSHKLQNNHWGGSQRVPQRCMSRFSLSELAKKFNNKTTALRLHGTVRYCSCL